MIYALVFVLSVAFLVAVIMSLPLLFRVSFRYFYERERRKYNVQ